MRFDTFSMLLMLVLVCSGFSLTIILAWRILLPMRALLIWAVGIGCYGIGVLLIALRGTIPDVLSLPIANLLTLGCYCLFWIGISLYCQKRPWYRTTLLALLAFFPLYCWFVWGVEDIAMRTVLIRLFILTFLTGALCTLLRGRISPLTQVEKFLVATLVLDACFRLMILMLQLANMAHVEPIQKNMVAAISSITSMIAMIAWGMSAVLLALGSVTRELRTAIIEREEQIELNKSSQNRLQALLDISQYRAGDIQMLLDFALQKVIEITQSQIGYIYHYSEEGQQFVLNSWSKEVMAACSVAEAQSIYQLDKTGIWGEVVRQRCPIMDNDYSTSSELKKGYPEGHVPLSRFLSIPVFDNDRIVAVVGVANKVLPYNQSDVLQLTLMMDGVWKIASRLNMEEQISRAGHEWQSTFDSINDSISLIDADQKVVRCNRATTLLLDREFADIVGQPCWSLFQGTDAPIDDCPMVRMRSSLHSETSTIRHQERWLEVTVDPICSDGGVLTGAVHIVRDVTERVNLANSIQEANDLFRLFMQHSPIYTFIKEVTDTESRVLQASDNFWDTIGITSRDMIGKNMHQLFPKAFADKITADDLQVVASQHVKRLEETFNGCTYITYKFPIERTAGKQLLAGYSIDITDRKLLETELIQEKALYKDLVEAQPAGMYRLRFRPITTCDANGWRHVVDSQYSLDMVSKRFCTIIGLEEQALKDNPGILPDVIYPEDQADFAEKNRQSTTNLTAFTWEGRIVNNHKIMWVRFESLPRKLDNGDVLWTGILTDITDTKQTEVSLREMQAQLMQNDKLATIGQLAAGVAHEINNPMGFVGSNMATLAKYIEKYNRYIDQIEAELRSSTSGLLPEHIEALRQSLKLDYVMRDISVLVDESNEGIERIKRIVQDLRTFSRADSSAVSSADLNNCMDSTINIVINEIKYSAELRREYGDLPKVHCNAQQINQIFMNLLINATHAIQAKGEEVGEIVIRTWCDQDNVFVAVSDSGCGISLENRSRVFDAFYTTKEIGKGTGLGLSISSGIVRKHGGEITLASEVGVGSTFTIRLPLKQASQADEERQ